MQSYLVIVLGRVVLFLLIIAIRRYIGKDKLAVLNDIQWIKLIAFPIFTVCSIVGMIKMAGITPNQEQENLFFIIACGLTGLNMLVFYFIYDIAKQETEIYESRIFRLEVDNQTKMYRSISENFNKQKKKTHEYKNQIMCI
ncbi:MAG: histidine kinase, partial [Lachnospiraceae bacterium]